MKKIMFQIDEGLSKAGKWFLLSHAFERFMNIVLMLATVAILAILTSWLFFQVASLGKMYM